MEDRFDYDKAMEELELIAARVEDPATEIKDMDRYVRRSRELVEKCRAYLRGVRESIDNQ